MWEGSLDEQWLEAWLIQPIIAAQVARHFMVEASENLRMKIIVVGIWKKATVVRPGAYMTFLSKKLPPYYLSLAGVSRGMCEVLSNQ